MTLVATLRDQLCSGLCYGSHLGSLLPPHDRARSCGRSWYVMKMTGVEYEAPTSPAHVTHAMAPFHAKMQA